MLNAFAYLDASLGKFIDQLRRSPEWKNTLVIILPDHGVSWPADINEFDTRKYHIPLIWTGGAVRNKCKEEALECVENQKQDFIRFGVLGEWERPYLTLRPEFEVKQLVSNKVSLPLQKNK